MTRGRIHPISLWVPPLLIAETALLLTIVRPSGTWRQISLWLVG